ncbi:hypothetical protein MRB53_010559 [Persea americana]|uniref:Uncharacterized protein n=1 Tax=Persea americana TaxID=3435 RepID=A0ACC2LSB7_PERAE|nr:hypothetical protein MRB53_010559 [Persea americana]
MTSFASSSSSTTLASSSSSATPNLVIFNITNLIPIKLDSTNFLLWKPLFRPILRSHHLEHFIDGSKRIPHCEIIIADGKTSPKYPFSAWFERDQTLLSWINDTLSKSTLPYIAGKENAKDAWGSLKHQYVSLSRSHVIELEKRLQHVKDYSTMQEYLHQLKTSIRTRSRHDPASLEELYTLLVCEELSLVDDINVETSTTFTGSKSTPTQGRSTAAPFQHQRRTPTSAFRSYRSSCNHRTSSSILQDKGNC